MTRGQLVLITTPEGDFVYPEELNGDMDPPYKGRTAIRRLLKCKTYYDFDKVCKKFLKEFDYLKDYTQEQLDSGEYLKKGKLDEFKSGIPYSEYTYILNLSGTDFPMCANRNVAVYKRWSKLKEYKMVE